MIRRLSENSSSRNLVGFNSTINAQVGTTYTLVYNDLGKVVELNNSSSITVTVPADTTGSFNIGDRVDLLQTGTGQVSIAHAGGVTLNSHDTQRKLTGIWAAATLIKRAANSWVLVGNISL